LRAITQSLILGTANLILSVEISNAEINPGWRDRIRTFALREITIMVNIAVLSEYSHNPPTSLGRVKIGNGPLYKLARVKTIARDSGALKLVTRNCRKEFGKLFEHDYVALTCLIQSLSDSDYLHSEWCESSPIAVVACDAYRAYRIDTAPVTGKVMNMEYFVKFAIGQSGDLIFIVSLHLS